MDTKDFVPSSTTIMQELEATGVAYSVVAGCVLARVEGRRGNLERCVVLRAKSSGVQCDSYDAHTAILLDVVKSAQASRDFEGTLFGVFQINAEGTDACKFLDKNPFKEYKVAAILEGAMDPDLAVGEIGFCPGKFMASADEMYFTVRGVGGSAATIERVKDPVVALADLIIRVNTFNSEVCVVSVGCVEAKGDTERVPDTASCKGALHTFDEKLRARIKDMISGAVQEIEYKRDVEIYVRFDERYPSVENDKQLAYEAMLLADSNGYKVKDMDRCYLADDFGYYAQRYPSLLYHLGVGHNSGCSHCSGLQVDDRALEIGKEFMSQLTLNILNR